MAPHLQKERLPLPSDEAVVVCLGEVAPFDNLRLEVCSISRMLKKGLDLAI